MPNNCPHLFVESRMSIGADPSVPVGHCRECLICGHQSICILGQDWKDITVHDQLRELADDITNHSPFPTAPLQGLTGTQASDTRVKPLPEICVEVDAEPTPKQIDAACKVFNSYFADLPLWEQEQLRANARDWLFAWKQVTTTEATTEVPDCLQHSFNNIPKTPWSVVECDDHYSMIYANGSKALGGVAIPTKQAYFIVQTVNQSADITRLPDPQPINHLCKEDRSKPA